VRGALLNAMLSSLKNTIIILSRIYFMEETQDYYYKRLQFYQWWLMSLDFTTALTNVQEEPALVYVTNCDVLIVKDSNFNNFKYQAMLIGTQVGLIQFINTNISNLQPRFEVFKLNSKLQNIEFDRL
jgi:hypothetical protein